jgi:hypothetical protein
MFGLDVTVRSTSGEAIYRHYALLRFARNDGAKGRLCLPTFIDV